MAAAVRSAILRQMRIPIRFLTVDAARPSVSLLAANPFRASPARSMSSHDEHLTKEDVIERVLDVIKSFPKVDPAKVTPAAHFQKDLGLDSLDTVEIVLALEEEFKLEIPDMEADKIDACDVAIEYIAAHPMTGLLRYQNLAR